MSTEQITLTALSGIPFVSSGDDLASVISCGLEKSGLDLQSDDVLIIAQKIVSKAEGCYVDLRNITPSDRALEWARKVDKDPRLVELILSESTEVVRYKKGVLVVAHRLGYVVANAGIDHSNVGSSGNGDTVLLLPSNPDRTCSELRQQLRAVTGATVGVVINDSHGRAWRNGTVGLAIGASGVPTLLDRRGTLDLFGSPLETTQIGLADEMAAAASLLMGQAAEGQPVVHLRGLPQALRGGNAQDLIRPIEEDLFR